MSLFHRAQGQFSPSVGTAGEERTLASSLAFGAFLVPEVRARSLRAPAWSGVRSFSLWHAGSQVRRRWKVAELTQGTELLCSLDDRSRAKTEVAHIGALAHGLRRISSAEHRPRRGNCSAERVRLHSPELTRNRSFHQRLHARSQVVVRGNVRASGSLGRCGHQSLGRGDLIRRGENCTDLRVRIAGSIVVKHREDKRAPVRARKAVGRTPSVADCPYLRWIG